MESKLLSIVVQIQNENQQCMMVSWDLLGQKSYLTQSIPVIFLKRSQLHNILPKKPPKKQHTYAVLLIISITPSSSVGIKELSRLWWITMSRKKRAPELFTRHPTLELWVNCHEHFLMLCHLINHMVMRTMLFNKNIMAPLDKSI